MKRGSNARFRRAVFDAHKREDSRGIHLVCGSCGVRLDPVRERWEADHDLGLGAGGADDAQSNGQPLCVPCHRRKTASVDIPKAAKSRRVSDKHFGIKQRGGGFWRPPGHKYQWSRRDD